MPPLQNADKAVYFEGPWDPPQKHLVSDAVADYESGRAESDLFASRQPWVCLAYQVGQSTLFCAHRYRLSEVLSAETAEDLARAIRQS